MDYLFDMLHIAYRQRVAFFAIFDTVKKLFASGFSFKKVIASLLAIIELFGVLIFDTPVTPRGEELSLQGYDLVFYDEFIGSSLDEDAWFYRGSGPSRIGYHSPENVSVKNGNLILTADYKENGMFGAGWYAGSVGLIKKYRRGYFEIRCICNKGEGFWSAFWIQAGNPYDHYISKGGPGGAEIDIFESDVDGVTSTVWCNGYDDNPDEIDGRLLGEFKGKNITEQYNTYGLKWTESEYIFYVNGVESARTSFGKGVSEQLEDVLVTLELPSELPENIASDKNYKTDYIIDYVKIYQTESDIQNQN